MCTSYNVLKNILLLLYFYLDEKVLQHIIHQYNNIKIAGIPDEFTNNKVLKFTVIWLGNKHNLDAERFMVLIMVQYTKEKHVKDTTGKNINKKYFSHD